MDAQSRPPADNHDSSSARAHSTCHSCYVRVTDDFPSTSVHAPDIARRVQDLHHEAVLRDSANLSTTYRHQGWASARTKVFQSLCRTERDSSRIQAFRECGEQAYVVQNIEDPSQYRVAGSSCRDRFCVPCAAQRSRIIAASILDYLGKQTVRFLTLTIKTEHEPLLESLDKLYSAFRLLRKSKVWTDAVNGGVAMVEVKWSTGGNRWHPHMHVLVQGRYFPHKLLKAAWLAATGDSNIVDIRLVRDTGNVARYVTKYAAKPLNATYVNMPERLDEAIVAMYRRRLVITFGSWRGVSLADTIPEGGWTNIGPLEGYITRAAQGDKEALQVMAALCDRDLTQLYARAPPIPEVKPVQSLAKLATGWLGDWRTTLRAMDAFL